MQKVKIKEGTVSCPIARSKLSVAYCIGCRRREKIILKGPEGIVHCNTNKKFGGEKFLGKQSHFL